ncbi:hypothetical protein [Scandinavium lactucae]|uniref:Uncharacterized protein n=1 Tax=Scandinavium lactucae TaxID=3095028 RepID=A0ABU4QTZ4_9ENTR|nr:MULTISPECIES: hypothetical protein [unclassified Scandinavium]MDX6041937.1 hypothetical protein [Scandinavium sp. V105_6]MDX6049693.1 hypothetical protein [Scandinavium sp. V105_1]
MTASTSVSASRALNKHPEKKAPKGAFFVSALLGVASKLSERLVNKNGMPFLFCIVLFLKCVFALLDIAYFAVFRYRVAELKRFLTPSR